jgi:hypothetical protein
MIRFAAPAAAAAGLLLKEIVAAVVVSFVTVHLTTLVIVFAGPV